MNLFILWNRKDILKNESEIKKESHWLKWHKREYLPVNDASIFVFGQTITLTRLNFADVEDIGFSSNVCAINTSLTNWLSKKKKTDSVRFKLHINTYNKVQHSWQHCDNHSEHSSNDITTPWQHTQNTQAVA